VRPLLAPVVLAALLGAAPSPAPSAAASPAPSAAPSLSVVCSRAPFYVFVPGSDRPVRGQTVAAALGQRFALVAGPRTTLEGIQYYETDVLVSEPGYPSGAHYWLNAICAIRG